MKRIKRVWLLAVIALASVAAGCNAWVYQTQYQPEPVDRLVSPGGEYTLTLFSAELPDFPFGHAYGRITLERDGSRLSQTAIDLADDGGQIGRESWSVVWRETHAEVTLRACEQPEERWDIYFDGRTERLPDSSREAPPPEAAQRPKPAALSMKTAKNAHGETVFALSETAFIEAFNDVFERRNGRGYLKPLEQWVQLEGETPFYQYDAVYHRFSPDQEQYARPTLSIFVPKEGEGVYELWLTFDDHGYQEAMYQEFRELCLCTFSAVLPELSDGALEDLYSALYSQTDRNFWGEDHPASCGAHPALEAIYRSGSMGLYGYYGAGTANICLVALADDETERLEECGIDSRSIP